MDPIPPVITDYIAAYNNRDVAGMMRCLTADIQFANRSNGEVTAQTDGIDAFRALAEQGAALFTSRQQTVINCIALAGHATVRIDYRATVAIDLPNGWRAGQEIRLSGVSVFLLRDDRIAELVDIS